MRTSRLMLLYGSILCAGIATSAVAGSPEIPPPPPIGADHDGMFYITYPEQAVRLRQQGVSKYRMKVDKDGLPRDCDVIESSGHRQLDQLTCATAIHHVRFNPVLDDDERPVRFVYTGAVTWTID